MASRRDGTSRFYSMPLDDLDSGREPALAADREQVAARPPPARTSGGSQRPRAPPREVQEFFATAAGDGIACASDLFGDTFYLWAVLGLIDPTLVVGDLGCGTGQLARDGGAARARVMAVDGSAEMLKPRARGRRASNVDLRQGELEALPLAAGELDAAMLSWCCTTRRIRHGRWPKWRASLQPGGRCWSWTCCRTSARSISSRWATCGSGFPSKQSHGFSRAPVSGVRVARCR